MSPLSDDAEADAAAARAEGLLSRVQAPAGAGEVDQLALDEQVIDDDVLEAALEERQKRKDSLGAVRKIYEEAHEKAVAAIATLELPEGGAARVGRFRIARTAVPARSVTFETKASSRVRISVADED